MKKLIRTIGLLFTIVKVSAGTVDLGQDPYLSDNIVASVQDISISKLLDFKKIAVAIHDKFDKARFHYIIAYEIDNRLIKLDEKFMIFHLIGTVFIITGIILSTKRRTITK